MSHYNMWRKGHPTQKDWDIAYKEAYNELEITLKKGENVIWDGGCLKSDEREFLRQVARKFSYSSVLIYINTPVDVILKRRKVNIKTKERGHLDRLEMKKALDMFEEPSLNENAIIYNSTCDLDLWICEKI